LARKLKKATPSVTVESTSELEKDMPFVAVENTSKLKSCKTDAPLVAVENASFTPSSNAARKQTGMRRSSSAPLELGWIAAVC